MKSHYCSLVLSIALLTGPNLFAQDANTIPGDSSITAPGLNKIDSIITFGKSFLGKPYRYKGPSPWPMDCSGYVSYLFLKHGISIPKSSALLGKTVQEIAFEEINKGDLMFFKGRDLTSNSIGHVSLVIDRQDDEITIMHSCSRGILIESYNRSSYYTKRYLKAGRVELPQNKKGPSNE